MCVVTSALKRNEQSSRTEWQCWGGHGCRWVGREGCSEEMNEVRELDMGLALRGKAFQAEGTAGAEAPRQEHSQVGLRKNEAHMIGAE